MDKDKVLSIAGRILNVSFVGGLLAFIAWIWIGGDFLMKMAMMFVKADIYVFSWTERARQFIVISSIIISGLSISIPILIEETNKPVKR
tara:strand:- start:1114 stop:1380 length:267 start_codon:yes stop_codon:yes gene_type:complete